jgi:hypothetical protein
MRLSVRLLSLRSLTARDRTHYEKRLSTASDGLGQFGVGRLVRPILFAGKESDKRAALPGYVIADRSRKHRILLL